MPLNNNNFLRFEGAFKALAPAFTGVAGNFNLFANEDFITITPLATITASNGLDLTSLDIQFIQDEATLLPVICSSPPEYDGNGNLKIFRPIDPSILIFILSGYVYDFLGNPYLVNIYVNVSTIFTEWLPYSTSVACIFDSFGNHTGYKFWSQLVLVNMSTSTPISPLTLKDNQEGDPDYYPPIQDFTLCAPAGAGTGDYAPLIISNFSQNQSDTANFITITNIFLSSTTLGPGGTPFTQNIPCNIPPGKSVRFMVPASSVGFTYDGGITISYIVTGNMVTGSAAGFPRYWKQNASGSVQGFPSAGLTANLVDNSGALASGTTVNVPDNSQGLIIFAQ